MAEKIKKIEQRECLRCPDDNGTYKWFPRTQKKPDRCPRCKSLLWETKKVRAWERVKGK